MELLIDDVVYLGSQLIDLFDREIRGGDWFVDDHIRMSLVKQFRSRWPDVPCSGNRHRNHRESCGDGHPKRTFLERMQGSVPAPGSLSEDDERIAVHFGPSHPFVDRCVRLCPCPSIDLDHAADVQSLSEHRNLVQLLFGQIADRGRDRQEQQRNVEVREMVRQKEVLSTRLHVLGAADRVAHWGNPQEHPAPHSDNELAGPPHPQRHDEDEDRRDEDCVDPKQRYRYCRSNAEEGLVEHRGSVVESGRRMGT